MIQDTSNQDVVVKPKRRTKLWVLSLASVFVLGGLGYVLASSPTADVSIERESLKVHTVSKGNLVRDIITTGKIIAANVPQVYSPERETSIEPDQAEIEAALVTYNGVIAKVAKHFGMSRQALYRRLDKYSIDHKS